MENIKALAQAYRLFLVELGQEFRHIKETEAYTGYADSFIDAVKSPEVGFNPGEANTLIKIATMFELLSPQDLPSHHNMKLMVNKKVDMASLSDAQVLTNTDFKEKIKDDETGNQERTYTYEIIKRCNETGNIKKVLEEDERSIALAQLNTNKESL